MLNSPGVIGGSGDRQVGGEMLPLDLRDERTGRREKERSRHESLNSCAEVVFRRILLHFVVFQHEYILKNMLAVTAILAL